MTVDNILTINDVLINNGWYELSNDSSNTTNTLKSGVYMIHLQQINSIPSHGEYDYNIGNGIVVDTTLWDTMAVLDGVHPIFEIPFIMHSQTPDYDNGNQMVVIKLSKSPITKCYFVTDVGKVGEFNKSLKPYGTGGVSSDYKIYFKPLLACH